MSRFLISMFILLYSGALMAATAVVHTVTGNVTAAIGANAPVALTQNATLESDTMVTTGPNSRIVMRFEDGQVIALNENTSFKINQYRFDRTEPKKSSMFFSLLKGALRSVSGLIGQQAPGAYKLQTPVATIGIRGTDFMAATGSLYLQVLDGMVSASNMAATSTFTPGQFGFIASQSVAPTLTLASQLPAGIVSSFSQLSTMPLPGVGGASGSGSGSAPAGSGTTASGAGVGGMGTTAVAGTVAAVAAGVALTTKKSTTAATTTVTQ